MLVWITQILEPIVDEPEPQFDEIPMDEPEDMEVPDEVEEPQPGILSYRVFETMSSVCVCVCETQNPLF